jgi:SAM-dependent methyltransferase
MEKCMSRESRFAGVKIDNVRDFWDKRPCNIRHSPKPVGTKEYFDDVEKRKYFVEPHIPKHAQFDKWRGKKVLEIGCGIGTDSINFARNGAKLTAVELSEKTLALCRKRFEIYGLPAKFHIANVEELSSIVPVETYDLVYSFGVLHHTPNPERAIAEIKKYMGRESELRIMLYSKVSFKTFWILGTYGGWDFADMNRIITRYSEAQTGCPVTYTYTFAEAGELLRDFEILSMEKDHIFPYQIEPYTRYEYKKEWYWEKMDPELFRHLEKELGWHTLIRARIRNLD